MPSKNMATKKADGINISVMGHEFFLKKFEIPFKDISPDPLNPRYVKPDGSPFSIKELREKLVKEAGTRDLSRSIKQNGLAEPLMVRKTQNGYVVKEGNRRYIAWEMLFKKDENAYAKIPVYLIPDDMKEKDFDAYLGIIHVQGKTCWSKFARAKHIAKMVDDWGEDVVNEVLGIRKKEIKETAATVTLVGEYSDCTGVADPGDKYYNFFEFARLREDIKNNKDAKECFFEAVKENRFKDSVNVRQFPQIFESEAARKTFMESDAKVAFKNAVEVLNEECPAEVKGSAFQLFEKTRAAVNKNYATILNLIGKEDSTAREDYLLLMKELVRLGNLAKLKKDLLKLVNEHH